MAEAERRGWARRVCELPEKCSSTRRIEADDKRAKPNNFETEDDPSGRALSKPPLPGPGLAPGFYSSQARPDPSSLPGPGLGPGSYWPPRPATWAETGFLLASARRSWVRLASVSDFRGLISLWRSMNLISAGRPSKAFWTL